MYKNMNIDKLFQSKMFKIILLVLVELIMLLVVFRAGMIVGFEKANFSYKWGENYHKNFAGPRDGFMRDIRDGGPRGMDFIDSHGTVGEIIKIENDIIVVKGKDNVEKSILIKGDTSIVRFKDTIKIMDLKIGDIIVVLGDANNSGQIEAKLVRTMPAPPVPGNRMPSIGTPTLK